jgi:transcriptional regulator with XRE-family HTH domain
MSASRFLVAELRQARAAAGLSQEDLGKAINYSASLVSAVENGQRPPTRDYLARVDETLKTGGFLERLLTGVVSIDQAPVWFRDWVILEREATLIRWYEQSVIPGLLQTEAYARVILEWGGLLSPAEAEQRLASRMQRQDVLTGERPPHLVAIIDENILHRPVGTGATMAEQCDRLVEWARRPNIHLHVLPMTAGAHCGLAGPFTLAKGADFEVVHLDNSLRAEIVDRRVDVDSVTRKWEAIRSEALPRTQSIAMIKEAAKKWLT